ncbi:hypothetical protein [Amycolatopsis magusensis]|uniref:Uncharacterized protein n=1 Tax=Amycolatopsis magusensis TaxID=882444 RepID=A0ABS4PSQ5_9PSEU|nr:hypothetical protein [Amycolatopsis magusensis]MBP2182451.1 hypothetical protein [Amycolatopsis magusensis]
MSEEKKEGKPGCVWFVVALVLVAAVWAGISELGSASPPGPGEFHNADTTAYSSTTRYDGGLLPTFSPDAAQELTTGLAELEKAYGVCFGYSLEDGSTKKSQVGSSRGPGVPANTCPRWLETRVAVGYTSDSSESLDAVGVQVEGSPDFRRSTFPRQEDFARLGVNAPSLVEDPVGGTGHAALGLPLLMIESGGLEAVPTPPPADRPVPKPLGRAGSSDFPLSTTLTLSGLGAGILLCVVLGFWMRARAKKKDAPSPTGPQTPAPGHPQPGAGFPQQPGQSPQPGQSQYPPQQPGQAPQQQTGPSQYPPQQSGGFPQQPGQAPQSGQAQHPAQQGGPPQRSGGFPQQPGQTPPWPQQGGPQYPRQLWPGQQQPPYPPHQPPPAGR